MQLKFLSQKLIVWESRVSLICYELIDIKELHHIMESLVSTGTAWGKGLVTLLVRYSQ